MCAIVCALLNLIKLNIMKLSIYIDNRRTDKDGMKTVFIRCYGSRRDVYLLNTGLKCMYAPVGCLFPKEERNGRPKSAKLSEIFSKCEMHVFKNSDLSFGELKNQLIDLVNGHDARNSSLLSNKLSEYASFKKDGTKGIYNLTARKVEEYDRQASLANVDEKWLSGFRTYYMKKGMSANGISIHLRNIRTVFNYARRKRETDNYPFLWFKIVEDETYPNNLTVEELRKLRDYPVEPWQEVYRDIFMLSFYLAGINVGDLLLCKDLKNGRLVYKRKKTGKLVNLVVCPQAMEIINKYRGKDYLLNVMDGRADYHSFMRRWNIALKKIGTQEVVPDKVGKKRKIIYHPLFPDITTYTARYTFASIAANDLDISEVLIGRCLGHSWTKNVTQRYISNDQRKVDEVVMKVAEFVNLK